MHVRSLPLACALALVSFARPASAEPTAELARRLGVDAVSVFAPKKTFTLVRTPGAFELGLIAQRLANSGRFAAVIALGAVIRGSTPHFDHVCSAASHGCSSAMLDSGLPVIFGVLTTDSIEQAVERAGTKAGNKGADAAMVALEMANLLRRLAG